MVEAVSETLHKLCARAGIRTDYLDIWGERHVVAVENLELLLREFGVDASAPTESEPEPLPPVIAIAAQASSWQAPIGGPMSSMTTMRWSLIEEDGILHRGEALRDAGGAIRIDVALPAGYHRLQVEQLPGEVLVIAAPPRCYQPPALEQGAAVWGPALQLYALRSERNWGIGDFGDLALFIEGWAKRGAGIFGLNPLHALFAHNPAHASPYSPSSRLQLNALYLDLPALDDFRECELARAFVRTVAFQQRLASLRAAPLVDYPGVAAAKSEVLPMLYASFRARHLEGEPELQATTARGRDFRAFQSERGLALRRHATFEALQARFHAADVSVWGWPVWPEPFRDPNAADVQAFVVQHLEQVEYHEYLQWLADRQLASVTQRCRERGLAVGLYLDLAVSVDRAGSDAWSHAECYALGASVGAPPDEFNPNGQGWGLPPLLPDRLRASGHAPFVQTLRAAMRHAGALRIDHVMALLRLYWIPAGKSPRDGAYVHYPFAELLAIVALESQRNRCMVIGEDLGTVADEVRVGMARSGVLSYRLLYFERDENGAFKQPAEYPREALVAVSTHDLATLAGWWGGHDLVLRGDLGLFPSPQLYEEQVAARAADRSRLLFALRQAGLLPHEEVPLDAAADVAFTPALAAAVHAYIAATPSLVAMVQLEDLIGVADQANLPGTTGEHPNWRRKLPLDLNLLLEDEGVIALSTTLAKLRPHSKLRESAARGAEAIIPRATYRLQLHKDFGFDAAREVLPYLERLGISHVYCSPIMRARAGSRHGYDIVAHDEVNPELGGRAGFERFSAALRAHGMGLLLDMVPNHMGVLGADNPWWMDVLENGEASVHARHFDIQWHPVNRSLAGKVLLPVLGEHYGEVLAAGQLELGFDANGGAFALHYYEHSFPLDPRSYAPLLERAAAQPSSGHAEPKRAHAQPSGRSAALNSLAAAFARLPARDDPGSAAERARDQPALKRRLSEMVRADAAAGTAIERALEGFKGADAADALDLLHDAQAYRLAHWRVAGDEINYRRFFDINDLAALRIEEPEVFEATQGYALDLAAAGIVDGLRIDHPDGLHDPAQYFARLQEGYARRTGLPPSSATPLYVVVEKIAAAHEDLPDWRVHGSTGYRYAMLAAGVLVDRAAEGSFARLWRRFSGEPRSFEALAREGKRDVMQSTLASELTVLATELLRIARADRRTRDYTFNALRAAVAEVAASMPVYRTYIVMAPSEQDLRYIDWAVAQARRASQAADTSVFGFIADCISARVRDGAPPEQRSSVLRFAMRFQQYCSPVAAKGVEDTAFYRYSRLVSLNEVGGDPATFGVSVRAFHGASGDRALRWPHTMLATSTHDNKRSEDVRNRISVLSEMPLEWRHALLRWSALNKPAQSPLDVGRAPSAADEYLLYQTLLGTLPAQGLDEATIGAYRERIEAYALKAAREAKTRTSWTRPDAEYEDALRRFVHALLGRVRPNPFLAELQSLASTLAHHGALNSLTMALLKFTSPGVPDLYQGNEIIDLSLVDPDNRRAVDYVLRARWLDEMRALSGEALAGLLLEPHDGRAKLYITWRLLELRRRLPMLFRDGAYVALASSGAQRDHVLAYTRVHAGATLVVIAARLYARLLARMKGDVSRLPLGAVWTDTLVRVPRLADGTTLRDALSGETVTVRGGSIRLAEAFARLPAAALLAE